MCGIAGLIGPTAANQDSIFAMTRVQQHRGPDGSGHVFVQGGTVSAVVDSRAELGSEALESTVALGHRRLAIVDCSPAGRQPMSYGRGRLWITYNGEVYNHVELRRELEALGHRFVTRTDTEVILAAYQAWDVGCFSRFNGMWAMAIWDAQTGQLVLSRDRLGVKPLYFARSAGTLAFASEIKGVLAGVGRDARLNTRTAGAYLAHAVINHSGDTLFAGIESFPSGCYARIDPSRPELVVPQRYWQLTAQPSTITSREAQERFRELFRSSVELRLRSDVPVGSCLSGGLDSSAIVCQMAALRTEPVQTFTATFSDPRFDESHWATIVSDAVGANAQWSWPSEAGLLAELDNLVWHQDEPFFSASVYAQWSVMRQARAAGVPVLLDGQGADETLLGYRKFYFYHLRDLMAAGEWSQAAREAAGLALNGDRGSFRPMAAMRYLPSQWLPQGSMLADFMHEQVTDDAADFNQGVGRKSLQQRQHDDVTRLSLPALLRYEDRNSMAWSIESRVPFLDYRLVEFLYGLPADRKIGNGQSKLILRRALADLLPPPILARRDKMGFETPQTIWMSGSLGRRMLEEIEGCDLLDQIINRKRLLGTWHSASPMRRSAMQHGLFRAGLFAIWARRFSVR